MLSCMAVGQRFQDGSVVAFSLQQLAELLQHSGSVGRNGSVSGQVAVGNADELGEELLSFWVLGK